MTTTSSLFDLYLEASKRKDIDTMASCWHDDCEGIHPLRPDRGWNGIHEFRRVWSRMWESNPSGKYQVISTACTDDRFFIEASIELPDGTIIPSVNVFEVENGRIRRVRVYTDVPARDGVGIDAFISSGRRT